MRILIGTLGAILVIVASANAAAQVSKDPPWNPHHIDHLPVEVRNAVLAICPLRPNQVIILRPTSTTRSICTLSILVARKPVAVSAMSLNACTKCIN